MEPVKKPKILRIIARLNVGGPALHCTTLSQSLSQHGFETILVTGQVAPGEASFETVFNVQPSGYRLVKLKRMSRAVSLLGDLATLWELFLLIRREKPDIVHTHTAKAGVLGRIAATLNGVPVIVHTFHGHVLSGYFSPRVSKLIQWTERILALKSKAIITLSKGLMQELSQKFKVAPPEKFRIIPLGRDLSPFRNNSPLKGILRKQLKLEGVVFGIVGRLVPIKDHALLLKSCADISHKNWSLIIVGDGPLLNELKELTEKLALSRNVHFLGWRADLDAVYASLDFMVLSSRNEGTPLSIIEAFASGCPVISAAVGGVPDMFSDQGNVCAGDVRWTKVGALVAPDDRAGLTAALEKLIGDNSLRRTMAIECINASRQYSSEALTENIAATYRTLLSPQQPVHL